MLTGLSATLWLILTYYSGIQDQRAGLMIFVFLAAGIFWSEWIIKQAQPNRSVEFKAALKQGLKSALLASLFFAAGSWFYYTTVDIHFAERYLNEAARYFREQGKSAVEIDAEMKKLSGAFTIFGATTRSLFFTLFSGVLLSAVTALIICKKN